MKPETDSGAATAGTGRWYANVLQLTQKNYGAKLPLQNESEIHMRGLGNTAAQATVEDTTYVLVCQFKSSLFFSQAFFLLMGFPVAASDR